MPLLSYLALAVIVTLMGAATVLSNLVSNVPAVLFFRSPAPLLPGPQHTWFTPAMATALAGNPTLLGSVANLTVAETVRDRGALLPFNEYLKADAPIMLLGLGVKIVWPTWVV